MQDTQNQKPIWNPSTVAGLSFFFTPVFGSLLQGANWRSLGQPERAASSKVWFYISLLVLVAMAAATVLFVGKATAGNNAIPGMIRIGGIIYYFVWYVVSGRQQVSYVKNEFGKTYAKKSLAKPILAALACAIVYSGAIFGLLVATQGAADADGHTTEQASASSGGSSFSLASLIPGSSSLDCAAPDVKQYMSVSYGTVLIKSGIPDLIWAVQDGRVKAHLDTIHETSRNDESKTIECAANLAIDFPKDDLDRATQKGEVFEWLMQSQGLSPITDATLTAPITYQVATASDAEERKQGPIVTVTSKSDALAKQLQTYTTYYTALAYGTPDITANSKNTTPWSADFKNSGIQACSGSLGVERCTCRMNAFEKVVNEKDMARIGFTMQNAGVLSSKLLPNLRKLQDALGQQCPLTQNLATVLGDGGATTDSPAASLQDASAVPAPDTAQQSSTQQTAMQPQPQPQPQQVQPSQQQEAVASTKLASTQPVQQPIVASFDCGKAASKIEKLICSTPATADADKRLASVYRAAAAKTSDQTALRQQQREWLKDRNACSDAACLLKTTEARIQALSTM
jgi:uncharacterized protein YecT (DUF1311 family)